MYLGIDLGGTRIKISLFAVDFTRVAMLTTPTESEKGSQRVVGNLIGSIQQLLSQAQVDAEELAAVGVGVPGLMDIERGISLFSPNFAQWQDVPIARLIADALGGVPVFIDNDVRVNLFGEWYFGAGRQLKDLVLLTIGTGLGAGVVMEGRVLYGATGSAGEIGHLNMYRRGRPCACGSSGCLGRYVSGRGLIVTAREKIAVTAPGLLQEWLAQGKELTPALLSEAYDKGDRIARETFEETGELLGYGLSSVINLYNPQRIIVGGGVAAAGERLLGPARRIISQHSLEISRRACDLVTAQLGSEAGMIGAAYYASQKLAGTPDYRQS